MKAKIEDRDKVLKKQITQLKRDVTNLKEQFKIMQRRLDFTQDEMAKIAILGQAMIQSVSFIVETAKLIAEREGIQHQMGLPPQQGPPVNNDTDNSGKLPTPGTG